MLSSLMNGFIDVAISCYPCLLAWCSNFGVMIGLSFFQCPALLVENGKFLLSAKRTRRTTCTEYVISMDADNISRSSSTYIGKLRWESFFLFLFLASVIHFYCLTVLRLNFCRWPYWVEKVMICKGNNLCSLVKLMEDVSYSFCSFRL